MPNYRIQSDKEFREFFGKRLRLARQAANLSQKGLAYYLRTGQDTISNYERGKVIPTMLTLYHIAEVLEVNVSYFFPDKRFADFSAEDQETLALIPSLSPAAYQFILAFVSCFVNYEQNSHFFGKGSFDNNTLELSFRVLLERDWLHYNKHSFHSVQKRDLAFRELVIFASSLLRVIESRKVDEPSKCLEELLIRNCKHLRNFISLILAEANSRIRPK